MRSLVLFLFSAVLFISCSAQKGDAVNPKEFKTKLTGDVILLDVRTTGEFQMGHLDKALNIDINGGEFDSKSNQLDKTKPVLVYCKAGVRSSKAAQILRKKGFKVTELNGGIDAWMSAGLPVVK